MTDDELDELDELALVICAAIDEDVPCADGPCRSCTRTAEAVVAFLSKQTEH
jgi:hypothetical protein